MSLADQQWCPTSVQVTVLQARGLRIKGKSGTNDAYAVMQVGKEKYQTSVVEKSVAPVWKEEAAFDLPPPPQLHQGGAGERSTLHVNVLHRALVGTDKLLGQAVINLPQLSEDKTRNKTEWFKLLDKNGKSDKDRGEVLVDIQFMRNNMTASMFDLSAAGKSRSRLGKFKDKVRGKKKESDTASTVVPSFTQVLTDSEGEGDGDGEVTAGKDEKKKKLKIKSLFSPKSNLQKNMSQSMSVLPGKNSSLSGSQSSGLNVDSSEGKKKFKFMIHKRSGSSDSKDTTAGQQKHGSVEQSNVCINGSHIYSEEPQPRTARIGSNFSLASSGHGSMEDVPESSPPSVDSLRAVRQYSPWTEEEEEEEAEVENKREDMEEMRIKEEKEEMIRRQEVERLAEEKRRLEEEERKQTEEKHRREEEERIRREKERAEEEERVRREEEERERLAEEKRRLEEQERRRVEEEEKLRREEEERIRMEEERAQEERRRKEKEEEERVRRQEEERERLAEEKRQKEEEERKRIEEETAIKEEEERIRMEEERAQEERRRRKEEEEERVRRQEEELERLAEEKRREEEEEERKRIEEEKARKEEEERIRMEEERAQEERRRKEKEEEERVRKQEEERERLAEEKRRQEEEERRTEEEKARKEEEERIRREDERAQEEKRRQEEEEKVRRQKEHEEKRRLEEEEMRQKEEERIRKEEKRKEEEEKARKEKEEYERLEEEKRKLEEEERKRIEEENIRKEEEERKIIEEAKRKAEMLRRQEEQRRQEEEEMARKEKEELERLAEEKRKLDEEERKRIEEEDRLRRIEQERIRMEEERAEEERRRRREEEERARKEKEEMERLAEVRRLEEQGKRRIEEEERIRTQEKAEKERKEKEALEPEKEESTGDADEQEKKENQTKDAGKNSKVALENRSPAEVTSTNPFEENFSNNPFDESPDSAQSVQQRCQSPEPSAGSAAVSADEKAVNRTLREKRQAPLPPGRNQAERRGQGEADASTQHLAQFNKQSKEKDVKTASVLPQRLLQVNIPLSRSPTDAKNNQSLTQSSTTKGTTAAAKHTKRPAPSRPRSAEEEPFPQPKTSHGSVSGAKQVSLNPFDDDEDENELTAQDDITASGDSILWPPALSQAHSKEDVSQTKIKSSKVARAPRPPAKTAATSSTLNKQNTDGARVTDGTRATVPDNNATQTCDPETKAIHSAPVQESPLQEPVTVQRAGEEAGGKKEGPVATPRRLQPVKPLNPLEQQSVSAAQAEKDNKSSEILRDVDEKTKVSDTGVKGPYSQLTKAELISLVLKQENQLVERDSKISELEHYIDNLLLRVMEEKPSILMSLNSLKKTA